MSSIFERLSNTFDAAKKAWHGQPKEAPEDKLPANFKVPPVSIYYVDTLAKTGENVALTTDVHKGRVEKQLDKMSADMDAELAKGIPDFDKLQAMIYKVIMMMMRVAAKSDIEQIHEFSVKIKKQAYEIQGTYNNWQGLTITVISAGISIAGGVAGVSPFIPFVNPESAKYLVQASQAIGTAGTGLSSIGSIFDKRSEGSRGVMQTFQRIIQDKEEERKSAKHSKSDHIKTAKSGAEEAERMRHQSSSTILGG
jgi:hypothetical protein